MPGSTASALTPMCRLHCRACLFRAKCRLRVPLYSKQASEQSIVSFVSRTHDMMSHGLQPRLCRVCITTGGVRSYTPTYLVPDIAVHVMLTPAGHIGHGGRVELHAVLLACTMPCIVRCMLSATGLYLMLCNYRTRAPAQQTHWQAPGECGAKCSIEGVRCPRSPKPKGISTAPHGYGPVRSSSRRRLGQRASAIACCAGGSARAYTPLPAATSSCWRAKA